jgi:F-type H+-transporting ATPase subunit alpha
MANIPKEVSEVGFLVRAKRYVLFIEGLPSARINDIIFDEEGNRAIVHALAEDYLMALSLDPVYARAGTRYTLPKETYTLAIGPHLFGRAINVLCEPVDGGLAFPPPSVPLVLETDAPGIDLRTPITEQLYTGCTLVDTLLPIARGQRQLIFGGNHSGKTSFLTGVVKQQNAENVVNIYTLIGKSLGELERISQSILAPGTSARNIVIAALSDQEPSRISIAPAIAFLLADHFQRMGEHVLVILDDLDAHAKYLREIALLEERLPGRESYPGDLFFQQAHLMERSGTFVSEMGGGSITTLPVVATDIESFSSIIPTNLMSCTDGHLLFTPELQGQGVYPAISEQQSVTRVGRQAQTLTQKQLSTRVRMLLGRYRQQREYAEFGTQLSQETRAALATGERLDIALRQSPSDSIAADVQVPLVALTLTNFLQEKEPAFFAANKSALRSTLETAPELQELRAAMRENLPLEPFLALLEKHRGHFENVCHA